MNLKNLERYLRVNLLGPGPNFIKKEFTGPRLTKVEKHLFTSLKHSGSDMCVACDSIKNLACFQHTIVIFFIEYSK